MGSKPILFSTEMVKAILVGRKTITRRVVKLPSWSTGDFKDFGFNDGYFCVIAENTGCEVEIESPYGKVGDEMWVKETFFDCSKYKNYPLFQDVIGNYIYKADEKSIGEHKWKPSIFMPRSASRIILEITDIRVERLNDINENDALSEGIKYETFNGNRWYFDYVTQEYSTCFPCISFRSLWVSINKVDSWYANPYVWVIEFRKKEVGDA